MADNSKHDKVGHPARMPHNKKKMVITASILMAAVPGVAVAMSITHADSVKPASVSVQASSTSTPAVSGSPLGEAAALNVDESGSSNTSSSSSMTVNGQSIDIPDNGTLNQTVPSSDGNTSVSVNTSTPGTSSDNGNASVNINIHSSSNGSTGTSRSTSNVHVSSH